MAQNTQAYTAMLEVINAGRKIDDFLNSIAKNKQSFFDASEALLDCCIALRRSKNIRIKTDDAETDDFLAAGRAEALCRLAALMNDKKDADAVWFVSALGCVVAQQGKGLVFKADTPAPATPAPLQIEITAMPERTTTSAVKYDADGNIKSTTQTERDAAPA